MPERSLPVRLFLIHSALAAAPDVDTDVDPDVGP